MNAIGLSPYHEANLRRNCAYLLSGHLKAGFTMGRYSSLGPYDSNTDCGTAGCFVGHGPYAGVEKLASEDWFEYAERQFGLVDETTECRWCSSGGWVNRDNTPEGAARRTIWLLEYGLPSDWYAQYYEYAPLCYQDFEITPEILDWESVLASAES